MTSEEERPYGSIIKFTREELELIGLDLIKPIKLEELKLVEKETNERLIKNSKITERVNDLKNEFNNQLIAKANNFDPINDYYKLNIRFELNNECVNNINDALDIFECFIETRSCAIKKVEFNNTSLNVFVVSNDYCPKFSIFKRLGLYLGIIKEFY